jgi:hypothetical protein
MAYFPSNANPYAFNYGAANVAPVSPVPSYQSSSQSSSVSYSPGSSSGGSYSISTAPSFATPTRASNHRQPQSPPSHEAPSTPSSQDMASSRMIAIVPSPTFDYSDEDVDGDGVNDFKSHHDYIRERGANMQALILLGQTSEAVHREPKEPPQPQVSSSRIRKEAIEKYNEKKYQDAKDDANTRALTLLDQTVGGDVKHAPPSYNPVRQESACKLSASDIRKAAVEKYKEKKLLEAKQVANVRALMLLDQTAGADVKHRMEGAPLAAAASTKATPPVTQHAPAQHREGQEPPKKRMDVQFQKELEDIDQRIQMIASRGHERLAESSRKPKKVSCVRDPETVAGMKDVVDIEREAKARKKALYLMNYGPLA